MTEQAPAAGAEEQRLITFQKRQMAVRFPAPEQLAVWKRTMVQLQADDVDSWSAEQVVRAYERSRSIIGSVLVDRADQDWIDDQWLEGALDLKDSAQIILLAVQAFADGTENRETRRATKKVTRRKAKS